MASRIASSVIVKTSRGISCSFAPRLLAPQSRRALSQSHTARQHEEAATAAPAQTKFTPFANSARLRDGRALYQDVWTIFNSANLPPECINLGQGYMNFPPPQWARAAAVEALEMTEGNHYAPARGRPRLRKAVKEFYGTQFGKELDPEKEIMISSGANQGLHAAWAAFLCPGDEAIMFEPFFDLYLPAIAFNGGKPVYVPLHPSAKAVPGRNVGKQSWTIDFDELRRAITPRTKMIVLNSPHNPLGKVFSRAELEGIAQLVRENDLMVISDEVYESLVFDGLEHVRFATLPGMWERTITVGSAGKLFAATGWRVGWLVGPQSLIDPALAASTRIVFCANTPMQEAAAAALEQARERRFFENQLEEYAQRRAVLVDAFEKLGMEYAWPEGSYFILLNISRVRWPGDYKFPDSLNGRANDFKAAWFIANHIGVSCIPVSEFYCDEHLHIGANYARFSFCKDIDTLRTAAERLQKLRWHLA
ncbi:PLP-dependent transferase [Trametes sanguinea]|nr:PLP-dependent transferase [Trametes sanguinea]